MYLILLFIFRIFKLPFFYFFKNAIDLSSLKMNLKGKDRFSLKVLILLLFILPITLFSQPTYVITDNQQKIREAISFFNNQEFGYAYPLLKEWKLKIVSNSNDIPQFLKEEVDCYYIACRLKMNDEFAEKEALDFVSGNHALHLIQKLSYYLAHYYYNQNDFENTVTYFDQAGYENLSNAEIANAKFEKGFALFNQKKFEEAKSLFNEVTQLNDSYYSNQAHYYYGFICYFFQDYANALKSFEIAVKQEEYNRVVPYYIAEILYAQGKKEDALKYGDSVLQNNPSLYYRQELNLLIGQLFFEKNNFQKALPLLKYYSDNNNTVSKTILYELSYCYYQTNNIQKAIEGFKDLSNEKDSLGQNSMYQLGSLYLSIDDKPNARSAFQYCANNNSDLLQQKISKFNYAKLSYELGYQDAALKEIKEFLKEYPASEYEAESKELMVNLLAKTNDFSQGIAMYESLKSPSITAQKVYSSLLYGKAIQLFNDQNLAESDAVFNKLMQTPYAEKLLPHSKFWRGEIAYREKRYDDAIKFLIGFVQSNPTGLNESNLLNCRYTLGYSYFQKGLYKNALQQFELIGKTISKSSGSLQVDAYVRLADCYYALRDFAKALNMYDLIINNNGPSSDYALFQKAMIMGVKNSNEKIILMNSLKAKYPSSSLLLESKMEIASTYMADQNFAQAIPYLLDLIKSNDAVRMRPAAYLKLGLAYYNDDKYDDALKVYKQLISQYPQSSETEDALLIVKDIYVEKGHSDEYIDLLKENGINIGINEADSLTYIAAFKKYESADYAGANTAFTIYLSKYINGMFRLEANYYNSIAYQKQNDFTGAIKGFQIINSQGLNPFYESATLELAKIFYFELKIYESSKNLFNELLKNTLNKENQLEAIRGFVRSCYLLKDYQTADSAAHALLNMKNVSEDDKAIALLLTGKSAQIIGDCNNALISFKAVSAINKSAWGAESRYETAHCYFVLDDLKFSEKAALAVIKETGSYDFWVTKSYILLGDIFMKQKDYFNAKATFESVFKNAVIADLKNEAQQKYKQAIIEEKKSSKIEQ